MTQIEVSFDEKTLCEALFGDKGVEVLLENVMNEMMEAELTEHIGAEPSEQVQARPSRWPGPSALLNRSIRSSWPTRCR
jgi:transposase-like protein